MMGILHALQSIDITAPLDLHMLFACAAPGERFLEALGSGIGSEGLRVQRRHGICSAARIAALGVAYS